MRLQKYMADCGVASRRASETYIKEGRVKVNGRTVTEMGVQVNPDRDVVSVDGKRIRPPQSHGYYAFYKPRSVASTCQDDRDRKTVLDYFKNVDRRLFPVGRLDYDSEGLMILTDDGDFALRATHPRYRVGKTYRCTIDGGYNQEKAREMLDGVDIGDPDTRQSRGRYFPEPRGWPGTPYHRPFGGEKPPNTPDAGGSGISGPAAPAGMHRRSQHGGHEAGYLPQAICGRGGTCPIAVSWGTARKRSARGIPPEAFKIVGKKMQEKCSDSCIFC